jgi:MFS superfamily sulfate permease-like transporter
MMVVLQLRTLLRLSPMPGGASATPVSQLGSVVNNLSHIPMAALAGVTAYMGLSLLEWSTWRRLHRMRRIDAAAFLVTTAAVLTTNAVAAVAIGCALHIARHMIDIFSQLQPLPAAEPRKVDH